jgi:hypothetical protein
MSTERQKTSFSNFRLVSVPFGTKIPHYYVFVNSKKAEPPRRRFCFAFVAAFTAI